MFRGQQADRPAGIGMGRANDQRGGGTADAKGPSSLEAADVSTGLSQLGINLDADAIERIR